MRLLFITILGLAISLADASAQPMRMSMPAAPAPAASDTPSPVPSPTLVVHMKDFAYVPLVANVRVGDTIQFINDDDSAHTVTADDMSFDSGSMAKGATWSRTFAKAGTIPYYCIYHRFMRATIQVSP